MEILPFTTDINTIYEAANSVDTGIGKNHQDLTCEKIRSFLKNCLEISLELFYGNYGRSGRVRVIRVLRNPSFEHLSALQIKLKYNRHCSRYDIFIFKCPDMRFFQQDRSLLESEGWEAGLKQITVPKRNLILENCPLYLGTPILKEFAAEALRLGYVPDAYRPLQGRTLLHKIL